VPRAGDALRLLLDRHQLFAGRRAAGGGDEALGLPRQLTHHVVDLRVDRLGRDLFEHPPGQVVLQRQPEHAAGDDDEHEDQEQRAERAAEAEAAVVDEQRHAQQAEPDVRPHPHLGAADAPGADLLAPPQEQFKQADQTAEDAEGEADGAAAAGPGAGAAAGGEVPDAGGQGGQQGEPTPRPVRAPVGAIEQHGQGPPRGRPGTGP
jgi:hypothetical protein